MGRIFIAEISGILRPNGRRHFDNSLLAVVCLRFSSGQFTTKTFTGVMDTQKSSERRYKVRRRSRRSSGTGVMIPYIVDGLAGVLTALHRQAHSNDPNTVNFSPDGSRLVYGNPADYYIGAPNVIAMIPYTDHNEVTGVLTAFDLGGRHAVYWSPDGKQLYQPLHGEVLYRSFSRRRLFMIPYKHGVLTYFVPTPEFQLHWSPDGSNLWGAPANLIYRSGTVSISAMTPWDGGVLTAFVHPGNKNVVCFSSDPVANPNTLDNPDFRYGLSPPNSKLARVFAMAPTTV